jgi:CheY-like chemotaxis protein
MNTRPHRKQPTIMIADHDDDERGLLRAILKLIGFQVVEASDTQQAIDLIRQKSPDVLVLDLSLPSLGGRGGLERIRRQLELPDLPIVAVSAGGSVRRSNGSATVFLRKPIEYRQLYTLIDRFLPGQLPAFAKSKCLPG